jgi:hypothetical protein
MLLLLAVVVGLSAAGCDAATLAYFFMPEARESAKFKSLASQDPKKEPRVVIFTWGGLEMRSEFIHADRQLSELLASQLRELAKDNEEKLAIVPPRKVEDYKNTHPNWRSQDMIEIGRFFKADYLVYVEINSLSLYEPGGTLLFRGQADLTVSLYDVNNPDDVRQESVRCAYPRDAPMTAGFDMSPMQFRQAFLGNVAKQLSYYFSRYPKRNMMFNE